MPKIDNEKFYSSAIEMYGTTAKGVNWISAQTQKKRFQVILDLLPKELQEYTLLDAGCGFGDFYTYLQKKKNVPKKYIGVDSLEDMYNIASSNTACEILIADITKGEIPLTDFVVCSGALNTLTREETLQFIHTCFSASTMGFVFNILHGDKKSDTYNYFTTIDLQQICEALKAKKIIFKDDYMDGDITVGIFK